MVTNPNAKIQMPNQIQNPNDKKKYDLAERTAVFGGRREFKINLLSKVCFYPILERG